jgi:hypothetical protein
MIGFDPTINYGLSDLTKEENLVYWKFGELIKTLVTLSSSADRQIEITGAGIVTEEMAEDFYSYFTISYKQFIENKLLDETAINKLKQLDNFLDQRSGDEDPNFWDDTTISTNIAWKNVRTQAREILFLLGYENLDIDFERTEKYEKSNMGEKLVLQTTRTRLIKKQ